MAPFNPPRASQRGTRVQEAAPVPVPVLVPVPAPALLANIHNAHNTRLPPAVTSYLENNHNDDQHYDGNTIIGGILQDTKYAWLSNSSKFTVINVNTGQKIAAWTFGAALRDFKAKVTCVYELPVPLIENTMQLLIGLECELIGGMVCLFHCNGSRVLRAIQVDCQVICMQYIEEMPGSPLDCFDGAVLIGTHGGATLILDLNRQSCTEAILNSTDSDKAAIKDELNVANLVVLSIDNIDLIVEQRAIARRKDHHIAVQINEGCIHNLQFILHNPDNTIKHQVERENVYVTSVMYVPQLMSVVIGLNIGAFQLWNLITLQLEFTSRVNGDGLPITHIAFLEPCDDPRAFCYIWIVHSVLDRHEDSFPLATMYSLTYQEKQMINENQYLYQHFLSCNLRFNIELSCLDGSNNFSRNFTGGRCISCQSLIKTTNKEDADEYVLNICQIVWECWTVSAISPVQSMMILFDIDQWYKEHMPDCSMLQTNNYMSVVNLGDTLSHTASSYLCDVKINPETLTSYFSVQRLEEHFYPNALGYECFCLTNTDITKLLTMGIQRQLLASINQRGPSILLHPTKIFQQCINSGLTPTCVELPPSLNIPESTQRQVLLSIALEARLIQFLGKCACDWATGSHTSIGCTLQLLLDWSWSRALSLKQNGDRVTVMFFNHSGEMPDRNTIQQLDNCVRQLGHIASLYNIILDKCTTFMLPETIKEIQQRQKVVQIVAQYFQVIQWFLNVGLLPEFHFDQLTENINNRLPYPIDSLTEFYQNRRLKLHCLNGENPSNEDLTNKSCKLLFIDQFIKLECAEKTLKNMWIEDQSTINGLYPPPSLHSLLKIYLIPEIKEEHKHSLLLYTLIDYAMIFDSERYENVIRRLMQFPTMFGLSNTAIKVTQAFWHLDHRDFQLALNQLQCVLAGGCLSQWQHNVVLSSLLVQKKTQSALQYLHVRKPCLSNDNDTKIYDDWEACSNLYLSRGLVYEAFNLNKDAMKNFPPFIKEERFIVFLNGCKKMGLLPKVLSLPLTNFEENIFVKFLKSIDDPYSSDILVMYYLNRSRYIEAQTVNEELKRLTVKNQLPYDETKDFSMKKKHIYKTETRDQLVDLYCKTLPPITRQLANFASNHSINRKVTIPAPMTVSVQVNTPKLALYKSTVIQASIDKASETWLDKSCVVRGIKRLYQVEETPFLCTPKLTRSTPVFYEKMITTPEETPTKKSKLDTSDIRSPTNVENISPKLNREIKLLLHTPTVKRQSKWNANSISSQYSNETMSLQRESTPQSILKVRKLRERCIPSPLYERYLAETDDELETASQYTQSDNLSRSIRFKIPSRNNTPSPSSECTSDMQDSFIELYSKSNTNSESSNKHTASPRKSIHHSCVDDMHSKETSLTDHSHRASVATSLFADDAESNIVESDKTIIQKSMSSSNTSFNRSLKKVNDDLSYIMNSPKPRRSLRLTNIQESSIRSAEKDKTIQRTPEKNSTLRIVTPSSKSKTITMMRKSFVNITHTTVTNLNDEMVTNDSKIINDSVNVSIGYDSIISNKNLESSYTRNMTLPENISILCSDVSEEVISDASFTTAHTNDDILERSALVESKNTSMISKDAECQILDENSVESSKLEETSNYKLEKTSETIYSPQECKVVEATANEESDEDTKFEFQITNDVSLGESFSQNKNINGDDASKEEAIIKDIYQIDHETGFSFGYGEDSSDDEDMNAILHIDEDIEVAATKTIEIFSTEKVETVAPELVEEVEVVATGEVETVSTEMIEEVEVVGAEEVETASTEMVEEVEVVTFEDVEEVVIEEVEPATECEDVQKSSNVDNSILNFSTSLTHESSSEDFANKAYLDNSSAVLEVSTANNDNEDNNSQNKTAVELICETDSKSDTSNNIIIADGDHEIQDEALKNSENKDNEQETCIKVSTCEVPVNSGASSVVVSARPSPVSTPKRIRKRSASFADTKATVESGEDVTSSPLKIPIAKAKGPKTPDSTKKSKSNKTLDDSDNDSVTSEYSSRRSTRSTSKLDASFVSDSSIESEQSARRKSRRSILATVKPNLSVIPEMSHTEDDKSMLNKTNLSRRKDSSHTPIDLDLYSSSRRLTRHQKSLLEKSMEYSSFEKEMPSRIVKGSVISEVDENSDDSGSVSTNYTSETLDPILLMDKNDFKGQPDPEENAASEEGYTFSRESSVFSNRLDVESGNRTKENTPDSSRSKPSKRSKRLLSEIRESPAKSAGLAVASTSIREELSVESPSTRLRRQSFNKAVEALSTPRKSRRLSTDSRKSEVNTPTAEIEETKTDTPIKDIKASSVTPKRSVRRQKAASVHGELSVSNLDDIATPAAKGSRKSLFFTPLSKDKRMSFIEKEQKQKPSYKNKTGVHKIVQPIDFVLKKE